MILSKKMRMLCLSTAVSGFLVFGAGETFAEDQGHVVDTLRDAVFAEDQGHMVDTLRDAVAVGIATNPEYGMVAASRRATDEELNQGKALFLPSIDVSGDAGFEHSNDPATRAGTDGDDEEDLFRRQIGITLTQMMETEAVKLLEMEERLHERIVGQNRAIEVLSDAIRRSRSGLSDPRRPIGSFIFLGNSGVGKTELAKALAEFLFDDEDALVRVDMSEYREQHTVSRLFGAPPGYIGYEQGGQLTEQVRRRPYSVVLFDEIEKAHPDVWNALLQLLDDGRLTDGQGRVVNFRNAVIVMTSNVGTSFVKRSGALGFVGGHDQDEAAEHKRIGDALKETFRPEFINRIDEIIIFEPLDEVEVVQIVNMQMKDVQLRLAEHGELSIELTEAAQHWLAKQGYDQDFGARPLKRAIQRYVESPLSVRLLKGEFEAGDRVRIDEEENQLTFTRLESMELPADAVEEEAEAV